MMGKLEIRPFKPEHAYKIWGDKNPLLVKFAKGFTTGQAYTAFLDNQLFACGGLVNFWPGCGEVWLLPTAMALKNPLVLYRTVKHWIAKFVYENKLIRLQAPVEMGKDINRRFIEHLGFHPEGVLEAYGLQGQDHIMYALIVRR